MSKFVQVLKGWPVTSKNGKRMRCCAGSERDASYQWCLDLLFVGQRENAGCSSYIFN